MTFQKVNEVEFPKYTNTIINMMPVIMGDDDSIPKLLKQYIPMINQCKLEKGSTVYLTIHESLVEQGDTQRRPGIHTDATSAIGWGGWGEVEGIYTASTDGKCELWDYDTHTVDEMGGLLDRPYMSGQKAEPNSLYWMTDRTPHQSLPASETKERQFFRLVSEKIGGWWTRHSTKNPLGVLPTCPLLYNNKFAY